MKMSGVVFQAWHTASKGVFHLSALRCLAKLRADTKAMTCALRLSRPGWWDVSMVASLTVRRVRSA